MKQELPNLVDERRFRRREPDQVERDEFGRVRCSSVKESLNAHSDNSVNGLRRRSPLILNRFRALIFVLKLLGTEVHMSNTFNKKRDAVSRSRAVALDSSSMALIRKVMRICICMSRKYSGSLLFNVTDILIEDRIRLKFRRRRSSVKIC